MREWMHMHVCMHGYGHMHAYMDVCFRYVFMYACACTFVCMDSKYEEDLVFFLRSERTEISVARKLFFFPK
jgi:hypothetical protein